MVWKIVLTQLLSFPYKDTEVIKGQNHKDSYCYSPWLHVKGFYICYLGIYSLQMDNGCQEKEKKRTPKRYKIKRQLVFQFCQSLVTVSV